MVKVLDPIKTINQYISDKEYLGLEMYCKKNGISKPVFFGCVDQVKEKEPELYNIFNTVRCERTRDLVLEYINSLEYIPLCDFCKDNNATRDDFLEAVEFAKREEESLYKQYLMASDRKLRIKLAEPISAIKDIIEGFKTGMRKDGEPFDIYEFYKMAPNKGDRFREKTLDDLVRGISISKEFPEAIAEYQIIKQKYGLERRATKANEPKIESTNKYSKRTGTIVFTYAEMMYLFTKWLIGTEEAEFLDSNFAFQGIKDISFIPESTTVTHYRVSPEQLFNHEDAERVFEIIDDEGYPQAREVFDLLKGDMIRNKELAASKKGVKSLKQELKIEGNN